MIEGEELPWIEGNGHLPPEDQAAWELALLPGYRTAVGGRDRSKVAEEINRLYHGGMPVRSAFVIGLRISKYKKELPKHEALRENQIKKEIVEDFYKKFGGKIFYWAKAKTTKDYHEFSEEHYMVMLSRCPEYRDDKGDVNLKKIADKLNEVFHKSYDLRSHSAVQSRYNSYKKSLSPEEAEKEERLFGGLKKKKKFPETPDNLRTEYRDRAVLASISSLAKQGIYNRLGVPINSLLSHLWDDPRERLNITHSYICDMFKEDLVLDGKTSLASENPSSIDNLIPANYAPTPLHGNVLKLSEDKRYITFLPLER